MNLLIYEYRENYGLIIIETLEFARQSILNNASMTLKIQSNDSQYNHPNSERS
jgi:hypothetical protein